MPLPLKIFINYRRDDRPELVEKIRQGFILRYGADNVFMDLDIPNYASFPNHLEEKVGVSDVVVACIGPEWLRLLEERAESTKPDYLVGEIKQALGQRQTMVATICIDGAEFPLEDTLPREIRQMLEFQIPHYQFADEFLAEIGEVMDDIEREYERRGLSQRSSTNLERVLHQSPTRVEEYLVGQINDGNLATIRQHLRDLPQFLIDETSDLDFDQLENISTLGDGVSVFGTVFLVHGEMEQFDLLLQSLEKVSILAYRRFFEDESKRCFAIWHEVLKILYYLGALAILEGKTKQLSSLLYRAVSPLMLDSKPRHWFKHLQRNRAGSLQVYNRLLIDILNNMKTAKYQFRQFSNDPDVLRVRLFQCDFIHCLFLDLVADTHMSGAWPFFAVDYFERLSPILDTLINDSQYRDDLFEVKISDTDLAFAIARYCRINRTSNPPFRDFWHQPSWENGIPIHISRFLKNSLEDGIQSYYDCLS